MKANSQEVEQLAFEIWQIYQMAHGEVGTILMWRIDGREEQIAWINIAVFVLTKLEALADALAVPKATEKKPRKKKKKKSKK